MSRQMAGQMTQSGRTAGTWAKTCGRVRRWRKSLRVRRVGTMRDLRRNPITRAASFVGVVSMVAVQLIPQRLGADPVRRPIDWNRGLPAGLIQTTTPELRKKIEAKRAQTEKQPDARPLTTAEMRSLRGRGSYRNKYLQGVLPWQRSLRDVNLCTGNLFKSFTDIQVSPARGAGLALQRTYNSDDDRFGPFGIGWTHAYDIRNQDEQSQPITDESVNKSDRADFFGGQHAYHRDADGLYTPPAYLFDELSSDYDTFLVNGPLQSLADTEIGMDGTTKHFVAGVSPESATTERVCDYIQDRYGNRTTLAYNDVAWPDGTTHKLLSTVTDPSGRQLTFAWTNFGTQQSPAWRVTSVQGPQYAVTYAYYTDPNDAASYLNLQSVTLDPGGLNRTTAFTYTSVTGQNGTENGLLASITDPLGHAVSYTHGITFPTSSGPEPTPTGTVWVLNITEPGSGGNHVWTISPGEWTYLNEFTSSITSNDNLAFSTETNNYLQYTAVDQGTGRTYQVSYDSANNVTELLEPVYSGTYPWHVNFGFIYEGGTEYTYGPHGNVLTQYPRGYPSQATTTTYYNASQYFQKQSVTDPNGHTTTFGVGSDTDANVGNRGSVLWVQDARYGITGAQFTYAYNSYGQKTSETNLNGVETDYTYGDQWGNLTQVVQDPGAAPHLDRTTAMTYDAAGHVFSSTDPNNQTSSFTYNTLGQPLTASFPATAATPAENVSYSYGANGRMESVADGRGTTTLSYEPGNDRVSSVTDPVTGAVSYTYGLSGERRTMTLPPSWGGGIGGGTWTYTYAGDGGGSPSGENGTILPKDDPNSAARMLTQITDDQGRISNYRFDLRGRVHEAFWNQVFNQFGSLQTYCYTILFEDTGGDYGDTHHWLVEQQNEYFSKNQYGQWQSQVLVQNDYTYDPSGQRLTNQLSNSAGPVRTEQYGYDELNRLTSVNYGDGQTQTYSFDPMGNRSQKVDSSSGTEGYTYNAANMLLTRGAQSYTNDANGNTLTGGGRTNTWDSQNRLATCTYNGTTSTFTYAADGLRHRMVSGGATTDYVLDSSMFIRELRNGLDYATYLVGPRGPEYRRDDSTGAIRWYCYDGLGSVMGEVDPSGNLTASRSYDVYGSVRTSAGTSTSKHKFVGSLGHPSDDETGLVYMRARYMDPATGSFVSEDPGRSGGNWFAYASADPVNLADATGQSDIIQMLMELWRTIGASTNGVMKLSDLFPLQVKVWIETLKAWALDTVKGIWNRGVSLALRMRKAQQKETATDKLVGAADEAEAGLSMISAVENFTEALEVQQVIEYMETASCESLDDYYMFGRTY